MKVNLSNNDTVIKIEHLPSGIRNYTVNLFTEIPPDKFKFEYREKSAVEFIFDSGIAISGGNNCGHYGIITNNNFYCDDFSKQPKTSMYDSAFWKKGEFGAIFDINLKNKPTKKFDESINLWFNIKEYWHWWAEDIPLIKFFRLNNFPIVVNKLASWQSESLNFFPDIKKRIIEVDTPIIIQASEYHVFSYPAVSRRGKTNLWISEFLKQNILPSAKFESTELSYISRGDALARVVENEVEIQNYLKSKGFTCYENFSSFSVQQKIDIFSKSKLIVAPTGSNLTHCHAMQPGSKVLDFNHRFELTNECGWNSIGTGIGVDWYTMPIDQGSPSPRSGKGLKQKNNNLYVELDRLAECLEYVLD
jgi:hypothetical protein